MQEDIIWEIISSKIKGEPLSGEELELFERWLGESAENVRIYRILEKHFLKESIKKSIDTDAAYNKVLLRIRRKPAYFTKLWRISACAALFAGILLSVFLLNDKSAKHKFANDQELSFAGDSSNVVLRLSNGKDIIIDKNEYLNITNNGLIANNVNGVLNCISSLEKNQNAYNGIKTPIGKDYKLVLYDGTEIWLNSDTYIAFPSAFDDKERRVKLIGEAYFKVAKNAERPFIVETENMNIMVTGTSFDVKAYHGDENVSTTLVSGSVKVIGKANPKQEINLVPEEQYFLNVASGEFVIKEVDTDVYTAWMDNMFVYKNLPLADIMRDISRWYGVKYKFIDEYSSKVRISANVEKGKGIESIIDMLNKLNKVIVTNVDGEYAIKAIKNNVAE